MPVIRNIWVENMNVEKGGDYGVFVNAYESSPVQNLKLVNCVIKGVKTPIKVDFVKNFQLQNVTINGNPAVVPAPTVNR
jgi:hypothetical protein